MHTNISQLLLRYIRKLSKNPVDNSKKTEAGFNMIEVVTVVIIVGILSAIIAPAWDVFVNRQRLRAAQNTVFQAMQSAQAAARGTRSSWQVTFKTNTDSDGNERVFVALHSVNVAPAKLGEVGEASGITENAWYPLAERISIYNDESDYTKSLVEVSSAENTAVNIVDTCTDTNPCRILFNYSGCPVYEDGQECTEAVDDLPLPIVLTLEHERLGEARRCVIVQTLIGSMRTADGGGTTGCQPTDQ